LLLVEYELIAGNPQETVPLIYQFLGEEQFDHNYDHVDYDEPEFDRKLGTPGLHRVHGPVKLRPRRSVLPPDLFRQYSQLSFWQDPRGSAAKQIVAKQEDGPVSADTPKPGSGGASQEAPPVGADLPPPAAARTKRKK
jgi:sulfotransferase